jgi:hypothetical protein
MDSSSEDMYFVLEIEKGKHGSIKSGVQPGSREAGDAIPDSQLATITR